MAFRNRSVGRAGPDDSTGRSEVVLVPAGIEAYRLYKSASIYCCPSSYGLPRQGVTRLAFYASAVMREVPVIQKIVEGVNPLAPSEVLGVEEDSGALAAALRQWRATFSKTRSDVDSATVFLLSPPDDAETVVLDHEIKPAGGDRGFQGRAYFQLEHLKRARSLGELRSLRDTDHATGMDP